MGLKFYNSRLHYLRHILYTYIEIKKLKLPSSKFKTINKIHTKG